MGLVTLVWRWRRDREEAGRRHGLLCCRNSRRQNEKHVRLAYKGYNVLYGGGICHLMYFLMEKLDGVRDQKDRLLEPFLGLADSTSTLYLDLSFNRLLESRPCDSDQNDMIERAMKMLLDAWFGFRLFVRLECTKLFDVYLEHWIWSLLLRSSLMLARMKEYRSMFHGKIRDKKVKKLYLPLAAAAPLPVEVITQAMRRVYRRVEALVEEVPTKQVPSRSSLKRGRAAKFHNLSEKTDKASMLDDAIEYLKQLQLQVQVLP
ncbi:hypothetical protein RHMOL_Rhmol12G0079100 [Rhododendron molle]|uniref:Uncharacterized protein n=1 Tax=Rhododendron molle TaxID=49168 RepID=A0ACC0LGN6_RHOML|nr:hypothetical protein RHMOL_Rhmol12G0079100 [Rhododendron molle]